MTVIRPARHDDLPAIVEIQNALLTTTTYEWTETPHTVEEWTAQLADKSEAIEPVLVADHCGSVVGWATYGDFRDSVRWPGYRYTVEHTIHVSDTHWGAGVGRQLMTSLIGGARHAGKRVMIGGIDGSNDGSIRFHARLGFREVARMDRICDKWGQPLDLILMQLDLTSHSPDGRVKALPPERTSSVRTSVSCWPSRSTRPAARPPKPSWPRRRAAWQLPTIGDPGPRRWSTHRRREG